MEVQIENKVRNEMQERLIYEKVETHMETSTTEKHMEKKTDNKIEARAYYNIL